MPHPEVEKLQNAVLAARKLMKPDAIVIREAIEQAEADELTHERAATESSQPTNY